MNPLVIGTRSSPLALWQASKVADCLAEAGIETRLEKIRTSGDKHRIGPLATRGGKGLFVKELESALLEGRIHLAVHSLKDVPAALSRDFELAACLPRADPRDCLVTRTGATRLEDLPPGSVVGSCSPRRRSQLLHANPRVVVQDLRGNVETRLQKVRQGTVGATFLAKAGLDRLGIWDSSIVVPLPLESMVPAAGQGIVAVEILASAEEVRSALKPIDHGPSALAAEAERSLVRHLGGTCVSPIGALARVEGNELTLTGYVGDPGGCKALREEVHGTSGEASALGERLAERLNELGAQELLPRI